MSKLIRVISSVGLVVCVVVGFFARRGLGPVVVGISAGALVAGLVWARHHDRRVLSSLPPALKKLAYRSDETSVAFVWRWRRGRQSEVRLLRSPQRFAPAADAADTSQTNVYEGTGQSFVDSAVDSRTAYCYSLFVRDKDGGWASPVHMRALTLSASDRASIERSYVASTRPCATEGDRDLLGARMAPDPVSDPGWMKFRPGESVVGDALGGLVTDAVGAGIDAVAGRSGADGWEEVL